MLISEKAQHFVKRFAGVASLICCLLVPFDAVAQEADSVAVRDSLAVQDTLLAQPVVQQDSLMAAANNQPAADSAAAALEAVQQDSLNVLAGSTAASDSSSVSEAQGDSTIVNPVRVVDATRGIYEVDVEETVLIADNMTFDEARDRAMDRARASAVSQVVGAEVQTREFLTSEESDSTFSSQFVRTISIEYKGRATYWAVLEENRREAELSNGEKELYYTVRAKVEVRLENGERNPNLRMDLSLNDQLFFDRGDYRRNDHIEITIYPSMDVFLNIFTIVGDSVDAIFPNRYMRDNFVASGEKFVFPPPPWDRTFRLVAELPAGASESLERIFVVATTNQVQFHATEEHSQDRTQITKKSSLSDLQKWLIRIPLDQRTEEWVQYVVREKN